MRIEKLSGAWLPASKGNELFFGLKITDGQSVRYLPAPYSVLERGNILYDITVTPAEVYTLDRRVFGFSQAAFRAFLAGVAGGASVTKIHSGILTTNGEFSNPEFVGATIFAVFVEGFAVQQTQITLVGETLQIPANAGQEVSVIFGI